MTNINVNACLDLTNLSMDWLRANHSMIHFFGLGFIQIKLSDELRMHFYSQDLPAFVEDPHNHRYDFVSSVLSGSLENTIWTESEKGQVFLLEQESCKEGGGQGGEGRVVHLKQMFQKTYSAGESYFMDHHTLHSVRGINAITALRRSQYRKQMADVTRPFEASKTCPFSQKVSEQDLWAIVSSMISAAKEGRS